MITESLLNIIEPNLLSNEQIGKLLPLLDDLEAWIKQVKEYALNEAINGNEIPGFKVVEGRSLRRWISEDKVKEAIKNSIYNLEDFTESKLISVSKAEALMGKTTFKELLAPLVEKGDGKPTLVPLSDKRESFTSNISLKDFE